MVGVRSAPAAATTSIATSPTSPVAAATSAISTPTSIAAVSTIGTGVTTSAVGVGDGVLRSMMTVVAVMTVIVVVP